MLAGVATKALFLLKLYLAAAHLRFLAFRVNCMLIRARPAARGPVTVTMTPALQSPVRENVTVGVLSYDRTAAVRHVLGGWHEDGSIVEELLLHRGRKHPTPPPRQAASAQIADARAYGGIIMQHYGHFIFESLSRHWFLKRNPGLRPVWHVLAEAAELTSWQKEIFAMLGLDVERRDLILEPTRFVSLAIPQAGAELWTSLHPQQVEALGVHAFRQPVAGRKLWLSRSRMTRRAAVEQEHELEELLARAGWTIMHPEALAVREQLARMADAEVIAGFDGSAFHSVLLGRDVRARLVIVPRGGANRVSATYDVIAKAKGLSQSVLPAQIRLVRGSGRGAVHHLEQPHKLAEALNSA
jgi:hypothetical protein